MTIADNKTRTKLTEILRDILPDKHMLHIYHSNVADAILRSPELSVTIREPRWIAVGPADPGLEADGWQLYCDGMWEANFGRNKILAGRVADWLNSESK